MSKISKLFKGSSNSGSHSSGSSSSKSKHHRSRGGPTTQEAIHKLRETEEMLTKKQAYLEQKIEQELATAKKHGTKNKRAALQALKRKKRYEEQLKQIDGTLSTIEFQRDALENSHTNTEVLKNMGYAAKAMKNVHERLDINNIEDLMLDIGEQQDIAREISEAISGPVGETFDEDELLAELEELEQEELEDTMGALPSVPASKLPSARHGQRSSARRQVEEDNDMRMLASWGV